MAVDNDEYGLVCFKQLAQTK